MLISYGKHINKKSKTPDYQQIINEINSFCTHLAIIAILI